MCQDTICQEISGLIEDLRSGQFCAEVTKKALQLIKIVLYCHHHLIHPMETDKMCNSLADAKEITVIDKIRYDYKKIGIKWVE